MESHEKDSLYSKPLMHVDKFIFDDKVAGCFDDMIRRSVPGYNAIMAMIGCLAEQYVKRGTNCYDLGCSIGGAALSMLRHIDQPGCKLIAVDNAPAMIEQCRENLKDTSEVETQCVCGDIQEVPIVNASMVIMNFTLQFIEPAKRQEILNRIAQGVNEGGILVLSEKIAFEDTDENEFQTHQHHTFKKLNGYSDMEISQKRTALEKVLVPDTLGKHHQRLAEAGFGNVYTWFQCFNFASIVAHK